jgi:hypothetical protein
MAQQKYRYRKVTPDLDLVQLQKEVGPSVTIDETHSGMIQNMSVDDADPNGLINMDDSMALQGFVRIGGPGVSAYPTEDEELSGWKETLLTVDQLVNGGTGGILQAILGDVAVQPADGDTFIVTDGTTTETFTFRNAPAVAFEVQIGASVAATEANLVTQINTDSTLWSASNTTNLGAYFAAAPTTQFVVYRTAPSLADDRIYGTLAGGQAGIKLVEFNSSELQEYSSNSGAEGNLPLADPAVKTFGVGRLFAALATMETHWLAEQKTPYTWDEATQTWISALSSDGAAQLLWGADSVGSSTTDRYLFPGYSDSLAQVDALQIRVARAGTIRYLRVRHNTPGTGANTCVYTVRKNGVATTLTATLAANASDASDLVNSFTVAAGDLLDVIVTKAAALGASPRDITLTVEFTK